MYREKFYDVLGAIGERVDLVVVPKNSGLKGYVWKVLKEAGFDLEKARKVSETKLDMDGLTVLLRRGEDVPRIVEVERRVGRFAVGVTGDDLFDEYRYGNPNNRLSLVNTYDWDDENAEFRRPTMCLMVRNDQVLAAPSEINLGINSKYECTGRLYLATSDVVKGLRMNIETFDGDLEETVERFCIAMCIDNVYSGKTRRDANLDIVERIRASDVSVIAPAGDYAMLEKLAKEIPLGSTVDRR